MFIALTLCASFLAHGSTCGPPLAWASTREDSTHADSTRRDSTERTHHRLTPLSTVTIAASRADRRDPNITIHPDTAQLRLTAANSPWELFREVAGVEAHEQGQGPGFASDLSMRGFSSDHSTDLAVYVDGVPNNETVNGHAEGYNDLNLLFPQVITSVDITKGPTSALYGNFAMGGAMAVHTMDRFNGSDLEVGTGAFGNAQGYGVVGFDHGTNGGVVAVNGFREDGWRSHSGNQYGHAHAGFMRQLGGGTMLDASADGYLTSYQSPGFLDTASYDASRFDEVSNYGDGGFKRHAQERISVLTMLRPNLSWVTTVYAQQGTWNFWLSTPPGLSGLTEGRGVETREYDGRYGFGGTSALTYAVSGIDATLGIDSRYTHAHYENYAESATAFRTDSEPLEIAEPARQTSGGIFLQTGFDVTRYARLSLGGRLDQLSSAVRQPRVDATGQLEMNSLYDSQHAKGIFSPKIGLLVRPLVDLGVSGLAVFANVSRGFRQTDGVITDPKLPFITLWDYETGMKFDGGPVSASASLFRMDVSNEQTFDPALNESVGGGQSRRNGLDVDARVAIAPGVSANTDFTILHAFYTSFRDPDDTVSYTGSPIFNTSKYVGSSMLSFSLPGQRWFAQVGASFQGPYTPFEEKGVLRPGYVLCDASAGVRLYRQWQVLVSVRNALDVKYRELESGGQVAPGEPRAIYAFVRASL